MIYALVGFGILYALLAGVALVVGREAHKSTLEWQQSLTDSLGRVADSYDVGSNAVDPREFAELKASMGLLPMSWDRVLEELTDQAEKASRERNRVSKIWERAQASLEGSEDGHPGLEAELDSAGVPYEVGSRAEGMQPVHEGVETRPANRFKWGAE